MYQRQRVTDVRIPGLYQEVVNTEVWRFDSQFFWDVMQAEVVNRKANGGQHGTPLFELYGATAPHDSPYTPKDFGYYRVPHELAHYIVAPYDHMFDCVWGFNVWAFEAPFNDDNVLTELEVMVVEAVMRCYCVGAHRNFSVPKYAASQFEGIVQLQGCASHNAEAIEVLEDLAADFERAWNIDRILATVKAKDEYVLNTLPHFSMRM